MSSLHLLLELPKNVIQYLQEFLLTSWENRHTLSSQKDEKTWRSLMNVNKKFYNSYTRKESIFIQLNYKYSLDFLEVPFFRERVLSLVLSPKEQIGLQFLKNQYYKNYHEELMGLPPYHYVGIKSSDITDLQPFNKLYHLELHDCIHVKNITPLANIHTLSLSDCLEITELPMLSNVHRLSLINCHNIPLTNINKNSLPNLQELLIRDQRLTNPDLSLFGFIHKRLSLHGPSITDISTLLLCEELELSFCFNLREIPMNLSLLTRLSLYHCHSITSISHLISLKKLILYSCHRIESINFTQLHSLEYLEISYCPTIKTILLQTSNVKQQKLHLLKLFNNFQLNELSVYYSIAYCDINQCTQLNKIHIDDKHRIYFLTLKNQNKQPDIKGRVTVMKTLN